jgi:hypothetical protein
MVVEKKWPNSDRVVGDEPTNTAAASLQQRAIENQARKTNEQYPHFFSDNTRL